jgi:hypothetical protein
MKRRSFRSPLAPPLGSVRPKVASSTGERSASQQARLCLCLWFVASIIAHPGSDYALQRLDQDTACHALHDPLTDRTISTFRAWPVHSGVRFKAIIAIRLGCSGLTVMGIIATLHIASPAAEPTEALPHFGCGP